MSKEEKLEQELINWFKKSKIGKRNFWARNRVGKVIKSNLNKHGHWRNKPRGLIVF